MGRPSGSIWFFLFLQGKGQNLDDYSKFEAKPQVDANVKADVLPIPKLPIPKTWALESSQSLIKMDLPF